MLQDNLSVGGRLACLEVRKLKTERPARQGEKRSAIRVSCPLGAGQGGGGEAENVEDGWGGEALPSPSRA